MLKHCLACTYLGCERVSVCQLAGSQALCSAPPPLKQRQAQQQRYHVSFLTNILTTLIEYTCTLWYGSVRMRNKWLPYTAAYESVQHNSTSTWDLRFVYLMKVILAFFHYIIPRTTWQVLVGGRKKQCWLAEIWCVSQPITLEQAGVNIYRVICIWLTMFEIYFFFTCKCNKCAYIN